MQNDEIVKICGIARLQDASFAMDLGYDIIGVILDETVPRHGTVDLLENIKDMGATTAAVYTSLESVDHDLASADYIQLHFNHTAEQIKSLKSKSGKGIISVLKYGGNGITESDIGERLNAGADLVLVENREGIVKFLDGLRPLSGNPRIGVAGKIGPSNVGTIRKFGFRFIDASSSLEISPGKKDHSRMKEFIEAARCQHATV
ncbi:MAG: phosphoribosylanthranilate isomerase [Candidatus Thermoplasmatota archaeon]|nr:phosphoribosylanthranilate isomerase [Candidatus Thermoplasmatota archaeon]